MSNQNPFVTDQLTARNPNGQSNATYELTKSSANPVRHIGRDGRGFPIEDTIPTASKWGWFLMPDGGLNKVPLRTGSVPSMHADAIAYENEVTYDIVMAGGIPAHLCPYSTELSYITKGPFAQPPPGVTDCGGSTKEGGCIHLQEIRKARIAEVQRRYDLDLEQFTSRQHEEYERMRQGIVQGVGEAIAKHAVNPVAARAEKAQRMREGKDE